MGPEGLAGAATAQQHGKTARTGVAAAAGHNKGGCVLESSSIVGEVSAEEDISVEVSSPVKRMWRSSLGGGGKGVERVGEAVAEYTRFLADHSPSPRG